MMIYRSISPTKGDRGTDAIIPTQHVREGTPTPLPFRRCLRPASRIRYLVSIIRRAN
jgi:hypothetical protein